MSDTNIFPIDESLISRSRKEQSFGVKSCTFWFCGLSGSGKSTLAIALEEFLFSKGYPSVVLDGDNLRKGLCQNLGFTLEDRRENVRRASEIAKIHRIRTGAGTLTSDFTSVTKRKTRYSALIDMHDTSINISSRTAVRAAQIP